MGFSFDISGYDARLAALAFLVLLAIELARMKLGSRTWQENAAKELELYELMKCSALCDADAEVAEILRRHAFDTVAGRTMHAGEHEGKAMRILKSFCGSITAAGFLAIYAALGTDAMTMPLLMLAFIVPFEMSEYASGGRDAS